MATVTELGFAGEHFVEHSLLGQFRDGRIVAYGRNQIVVSGPGNIPLEVRVPDLRYIDQVIHIQFDADPICDPGTPMNKEIRANLVGLTLIGLAHGTTLGIMIVAIGG